MLPLHYIWEANIVISTPLHLFDSFLLLVTLQITCCIRAKANNFSFSLMIPIIREMFMYINVKICVLYFWYLRTFNVRYPETQRVLLVWLTSTYRSDISTQYIFYAYFFVQCSQYLKKKKKKKILKYKKVKLSCQNITLVKVKVTHTNSTWVKVLKHLKSNVFGLQKQLSGNKHTSVSKSKSKVCISFISLYTA